MFIKVDGAKAGKEIASMYRIPSYPKFMVIHPNSNNGKLIDFFDDDRTASSFKKWAKAIMKDVEPLEVT